MRDSILEIARQFETPGVALRQKPARRGLINDSYVVTCDGPKGAVACFLQRLNSDVFADPAAVMRNTQRVIDHVRHNAGTGSCRLPAIIGLKDGRTWFEATDGTCWRMFEFVEGATAGGQTPDAATVARAGQAFGSFHDLCRTLGDPPLEQTLRDFHNVPKRLDTLERALTADPRNRARTCAAEVARIKDQRHLARALDDAALPIRVVHNDAQLDNLLIDARDGRVLAIVDLDTVMPGPIAHDFGDMMRTMLYARAPDFDQAAAVHADAALFRELARGYLQATAAWITQPERQHLVTAGLVITYEQAVRYLTDHLAGDAYYHTTDPQQNLQRCRLQLDLLESMIDQRERLEAIIRELE